MTSSAPIRRWAPRGGAAALIVVAQTGAEDISPQAPFVVDDTAVTVD